MTLPVPGAKLSSGKLEEVTMPLVTIKMVEGRTIDQKRALVKDVTEAICKNIGVPSSAVHIDIVDLKRENLADGGQLFCDRK